MKFATGAATHTGLVRDNNEDAFLVDDARALYAVADGIGGHRGGEVASRTAIEALRAAVASGRPVNEAITLANTAVLERAAGDAELTGMGTTMTAGRRRGRQQVLVGHVGDSRAYLLHEGVLRRITDDHSLVEELVREGRLTHEQAESHPQRNIVTRALGVDAEVEVDLYTSKSCPAIAWCSAPTGSPPWCANATSNGSLRGEPDPQRAAELLVDAANRAGGEDNTSVVVVDVLEVDPEVAADPDVLAQPDPSATPVHRPPMRPAPEPAAVPARAPAASWGSRIRGTLLLFVPLILVLGHRGRRRRLLRAPVVLRRIRGQPRRDLQGRARRSARLGSDDRAAHRAHRRPTDADRSPTRRGGRRTRVVGARAEFVANLRGHAASTTRRQPRRRTHAHDLRPRRPPPSRAPAGHRGPLTMALAPACPHPPTLRAVARAARDHHDGRRIRAGRARQRARAPTRPLRTPCVGVRSLPRRSLRDPALRARSPTRPCSRWPRC